MSTEPYPEVNGDESGIVPNQSARSPDWPKKIRTLTAAELDRLTIDGAGRFYWDGKLVNYEPPQQKPQAAQSPDDSSSQEMLDRASYELGDHKTPEPIEGAELPQPLEARSRSDDMRAVDLDTLSAPSAGAPMAETRAVSMDDSFLAAPAIRVPDRVRVSLSRWQSLGAIIVVLGMLIGASGMAAYGLVVAHDWGCRIGMVTNYCPASPSDRPVRPDIPA